MSEPYTKLLKRIVEWDYFSDAHALQLLIYLISTVNFKAEKWRGIQVKVGQKITSIEKMADACGCSKNTIQRCLKILQDSGTIDVQSDNKKTIITLHNYAKYQRNTENSVSKNDMQPDTQVDMQPDTQPDTQPDHNIRSKEYKKEKNINSVISPKPEKEPKKTYGEYQNVTLTDNEAQKLHNEFSDNAAGMVEYLSAYKIEKNYKTKSDYLTIKRWVADAYYKQLNQNQNGNNGTSTRSIQERMQRIVSAGAAMAAARR